jgi:hypothetical protein
VVANRGIVDHRIEVAEFIDSRGDFLCAGDSVEVALHDGLGFRQRAPGVIGPGGVSGVQDDLMTLADEPFARHQAEAG